MVLCGEVGISSRNKAPVRTVTVQSIFHENVTISFEYDMQSSRFILDST